MATKSKTKRAVVPVHPLPNLGDELLTPDQVAAMLRVTRAKVIRTLIRREKGPLRAKKHGREYRIWLSDVVAYLKAIDPEKPLPKVMSR